MKKSINTKLFTFVFACLLFPLFGCEKDNDSKPAVSTKPVEENQVFDQSGNISAVINGEFIDHSKVWVNRYRISRSLTITGYDTSAVDTTNELRISLPMDPTSGTFSHSDPYFGIAYEVVTGDSDNGYYYNRDMQSEINVTYDSIGFSADTTFYKVVGTFSLSGKHEIFNDSITIENGEFDLIYGMWF